MSSVINKRTGRGSCRKSPARLFSLSAVGKVLLKIEQELDLTLVIFTHSEESWILYLQPDITPESAEVWLNLLSFSSSTVWKHCRITSFFTTFKAHIMITVNSFFYLIFFHCIFSPLGSVITSWTIINAFVPTCTLTDLIKSLHQYNRIFRLIYCVLSPTFFPLHYSNMTRSNT